RFHSRMGPVNPWGRASALSSYALGHGGPVAHPPHGIAEALDHDLREGHAPVGERAARAHRVGRALARRVRLDALAQIARATQHEPTELHVGCISCAERLARAVRYEFLAVLVACVMLG